MITVTFVHIMNFCWWKCCVYTASEKHLLRTTVHKYVAQGSNEGKSGHCRVMCHANLNISVIKVTLSHPLMRKNCLANQIKFLRLAHYSYHLHFVTCSMNVQVLCCYVTLRYSTLRGLCTANDKRAGPGNEANAVVKGTFTTMTTALPLGHDNGRVTPPLPHNPL